MIKILIIMMAIIMTTLELPAEKQIDDEKRRELEELEIYVNQAKQKIRVESDVQAIDFTTLFPQITISKHSPYEGFAEDDIYIGASFNTGGIFSIIQASIDRRAAKERALRMVQRVSFRIRRLIGKKYLLKEIISNYIEIKMSGKDPVKIARLEEKIDNLNIAVEELEIEIEKGMAEIETVSSDLIIK